MKITKTISTELDKLSRRIVKVLRMGKSDVQTSFEASPAGIDSNPIKDMIAVYAETGEKGKTVIVGYIKKELKAELGELRLFSTNDQGAEKFHVWLKNDGTMEVNGNTDWMVRFSELEKGFNTFKGDFNTFVSVFNAHTHVGNLGAPTTPPASPGATTAASIADAKIKEIKTY